MPLNELHEDASSGPWGSSCDLISRKIIERICIHTLPSPTEQPLIGFRRAELIGVVFEAGDGHALLITVLVNPVMLALTQLHKAYAQTLTIALYAIAWCNYKKNVAAYIIYQHDSMCDLYKCLFLGSL